MQLACGDPTAVQGQEHGKGILLVRMDNMLFLPACRELSVLSELGTMTPFPGLPKALLTWDSLRQQLTLPVLHPRWAHCWHLSVHSATKGMGDVLQQR